MSDPIKMLSSRFGAAIVGAFGESYAGTDPLLSPARNLKFGDYQANVAMSLAKPLKQPPRKIAEAIMERLDLSETAEEISIAGPGFINVRLRDDFLEHLGQLVAQDEHLGVRQADEPETVVVDYSGPNVAKEMHVGHLRSSVIGDAIARALAYAGHQVIRQNHLGDWGTQFGMLIENLIDQGVGTATDVEISDLNAFYKEAKVKFDANPDFKDRARKRVVALQGGDEQTLSLWQWLVDESVSHFDIIYERLGVQLTREDIRPESFYNDRLPQVVEDVHAIGVLTESEGAQCVFVPGYTNAEGNPVPLIVQKADGGFGYAATDLAAIRYRMGELNADRIAYVVDARQGDHFAQVFWLAEKLDWLGESSEAEHVKFGTILGEDGKPFKTRSGETVKLIDLLDEACDRAEKIIVEKRPELSEDARKEIASVVGIGAVKYGDLSGERSKDYKFSWDRMLAFEGNTAPYLVNAYVRARSILRKAGADGYVASPEMKISDPAERALVLQLVRFDSAVHSVVSSFEPHRLCLYLYELASGFHQFFERCPVLRAESDELRASRLQLCAVTATVLQAGLELLGIETVEEM